MSRFAFRVRRPDRPMSDALPMINVAFLLLVFFLMVASISPAPPLEVDLPEADGARMDVSAALYVGPGGELAYGRLRGDEALAAAVVAEGPLTVRADRGAAAADLAALLRRLRETGVEKVSLAVATRP